MQFEEWSWLENGNPSHMEPGEYAYSMLDRDGNVLKKVTYAGSFSVSITPGGTFPIDTDTFAFTIPYPKELVTQITQSHGNKVIATFEPNSKLLREAVSRIPDQEFHQDAEERRTPLHNEIDALEELIQDGDLTGAARLLENDIKDNFARWLNDYESDNILQFTKEEIVILIDDILYRLTTAAVAPRLIPTPTPTVVPTATPVPTPSPADIALLRTAEDLALSWIRAASEGDVDFLVELAGAPFFWDKGLLVSEAELQARIRELYANGYERPFPVSDIKASAFTRGDLIEEYERLGYNPSRDRFLSKMDFADDDIAVMIEIQGQGIIICFRRIGSELEIVSLGG